MPAITLSLFSILLSSMETNKQGRDAKEIPTGIQMVEIQASHEQDVIPEASV